MIYKKVLIFVLTCLLSGSLLAQHHTISNHRDSLKNSQLIKQTTKLQEIASVHQSDSIQKAVVLQLQNLNVQDSTKIRLLVTTLQALKLSDSLEKSQLPHHIDSLKRLVTGFQVIPFDQPLFTIRSPLGAFSPQERAKAITEKLKQLARDYVFHQDSLVISSQYAILQIQYAHQPILSIDTTDALWMNSSKLKLAQHYRNQIALAMASHQQATSLQSLLKEAGLAILVILAVTLLIYFIRRLAKKLSRKITEQRGKRINGIKIKSYELFNAGQQISVLLFFNNVIKWSLIILLVYLALPVLFGLFPWTRGIATTLFGLVLNPAKKIIKAFWNYMPNLFTVLLIGVVFWYFLKGIRYLKREIEKGNLTIPGFYADWAAPTYQIVRVIVLAFMFILIFPYLPGSNSLAFKGVSVFLGVLFTFGSAGPLGNLISGMVLTYMRSFKVGDRVKIGEVTGDIMEETLLVIRIRTIKNEIISIPNSSVLASHTINYSSESAQEGLIINTTITMGYNTPWKQVHELLIQAALQTEYIQPSPAPYVYQTKLDDYYASYQINAYTREANQQDLIYSNLHQHIQNIFNDAGLELVSPHYRVIRTERT
ncbi:mechanosensitive ion channel [Mucilaginibacter robiniae]|uniref:Mechanosensitive ion channel n=1 Tax=Mucilaginibacter robiniae TaxID=2728022 RepID=A0A7L5E2I6_9SPHI|nr:mechanosensitive ion channel family protein [Mucilaginibacter robiniae]QJD96529.1 mechanosensitive ion channel [Mucilaginibacter robiniae]